MKYFDYYLHPLELGKLMRRLILDTRHVLNLGSWFDAGFKTLLLGATDGLHEPVRPEQAVPPG